jgi:hypothetical protein
MGLTGMKNLNSWFEIDEKEYMWYILKGYTVTSEVDNKCVVWKMDGKRHRTDGPAVIHANGYQAWYLDGKRHRTDDPAFIRADGYQAWYLDDKPHRADGPAVIDSDGSQWWYLDGKRHRTDGPAVIHANGSQWWLDGKEYTEKEFNDEKSKLLV